VVIVHNQTTPCAPGARRISRARLPIC